VSVAFAVSFSQLLLSVVFVVAAVAKLADRPRTRAAIEAFGVRRMATPAATLLPVIELLVAVALVPAASARWGALGALALIGVFSLAVLRALRLGSTPDCNCFGGLAQTEVGRGTLVRNGLLGSVAVFIALGGKSVSAFDWVLVPAAQDRAAIVFLMAGLAALSWFCWQLLRQNGRLLQRLETEGAASPPLQAGDPAPGFSGRDLHGERVSLDSLLALGRPVALVFTDPGCGACTPALEAVVRAQHERADELTLAVLSTGSIDRIEAKAAEFGLDRVVPQADDTLFDAYRVYGVPGLVEIDQTGVVAKPASLGAAAITEAIFGISPIALDQRLEVAVG
jgi:peroxiredoxin